MARERELSAEELAALEDERAFLLRSLDDLDEELAAGDVDEHDYEALRDDYTARAARVIRTIERHQAREAAPESGTSRWRKVAVAAGVVVFALGCGALVAQAAGRRGAGDTATGQIRETSRQRIDEAIGLAQQEDYEGAIDLLDEVIEDAPDNVEAFTFKGWFLYLSGNAPKGLVTLVEARNIDAEYPATHAFLAKLFSETGQPDFARKELEILDGLDPPPGILQLVEPLREELDQPGPSSTATTAAP